VPRRVREEIPSSDALIGTYLAYDRSGREIWRKEGFVVGRDSAPPGLSVVMGASRIIDPATGEVLRSWNPWNVL